MPGSESDTSSVASKRSASSRVSSSSSSSNDLLANKSGASTSVLFTRDIRRSYNPPIGFTKVEIEDSAFDWDKVHDNQNISVCLIRAPQNLKHKHLEGLHVDLSSGTKDKPIGSFTASKKSFNVHLQPKQLLEATNQVKSDQWGNLIDGRPTILEEIKDVTCLFPSSKAGCFKKSTRDFDHVLTITEKHDNTVLEPVQVAEVVKNSRPQIRKLGYFFNPIGSEESSQSNISLDPKQVAVPTNQSEETHASPNQKPKKKAKTEKKSKKDDTKKTKRSTD